MELATTLVSLALLEKTRVVAEVEALPGRVYRLSRPEALYRMCRSKRRYHDHKEAKRAARWLKNDHGAVLRTYRCPVCNGVHFSSKE